MRSLFMMQVSDANIAKPIQKENRILAQEVVIHDRWMIGHLKIADGSEIIMGGSG